MFEDRKSVMPLLFPRKGRVVFRHGVPDELHRERRFRQCSKRISAIRAPHGLKIYHVDRTLYPYVQVYFRTFDKNMHPLVNLNERTSA